MNVTINFKDVKGHRDKENSFEYETATLAVKRNIYTNDFVKTFVKRQKPLEILANTYLLN